MEDFYGVLFMVVAILFSVVSKLNKKKEETEEPFPLESEDNIEEEELMFEEIVQPQETPQPQPFYTPTQPETKRPSTPPAATKVAALKKDDPIPADHTAERESEEYAIHNAEEARKAIIWGEILQRKYT